MTSANLTPASGCQDHTTSPSAGKARFVLARHRRPPHPAAHVRDDRETPLMWDGTAKNIHLICISEKQKYFREGGWTGRASGPQATARRANHRSCMSVAIGRVRKNPDVAEPESGAHSRDPLARTAMTTISMPPSSRPALPRASQIPHIPWPRCRCRSGGRRRRRRCRA